MALRILVSAGEASGDLYASRLVEYVKSLGSLYNFLALAVIGGQGLLRFVNIATIRKITAAVLFLFAGVAVFQAVR